MSNPAIRLSNVSKCFAIYDQPHHRLLQSIFLGRRKYHREFWALRDVSFEVNRGETVAIVGRNGSGKSTLLQLIAGTMAPSSGDITVAGRTAALLELGAGFNPEFSGRENVYVTSSILGLTREETDARFDAIAGFADIGEFLDQPVKTYSSGMYARLGFAVAINVNPDVLIVDETLSVGDEAFSRKCFAKIEQLQDAGTSILFVSHAPSVVTSLCSRAILLDGGEHLLTGSAKSVIARYQRLLYASPDKTAAIRDEIRLAAQGEADEEVFDLAVDPQAGGLDTSNQHHSDDAYDPSLRSQSLVEYESQGARIHSPKITDIHGRQVNILTAGGDYVYTYDVAFDKTATGVRFGMLIKTVSGIEVGGLVSHPTLGKAIPLVEGGSAVTVRFHFTAKLTPGTYFLNAGVTGTAGSHDEFLHRLLDAVIFRVCDHEGLQATSIVDFSRAPVCDWERIQGTEGRVAA